MSKTINVTSSFMPPLEEYTALLHRVWESKWLTNYGELHREFEEQLKAYLGASHLALFCNGHMALELALHTLSQVGGEIITTAYSFCSTVNAIVRCGYTPVFCDIRESDLTIDPALIEEKITDKTVAIVATHVYGFPCDDAAIGAIAERHGLAVIYDAAHAFGVSKDGVGVAQMGDMAMFSTHASKVFHTVEGGILCLKSEADAQKVRELSNFGQSAGHELRYPGPNGKMNEFEAAMGICNLRYLDQNIRRRKELAEHYICRLAGRDGIALPQPAAGTTWNYAYFPVLFDKVKWNRDAVAARLNAEGVAPRKYFSPALHQTACYQNVYSHIRLPVTERAAEEILTLPLYENLSNDDVDTICDIILCEGGFSK